MKKTVLIMVLLFMTISLSACGNNSGKTSQRNLPGLTEDLTITGEIVGKRDNDFTVQIKNSEGTTDWIGLGNQVVLKNGQTKSFAEIKVGQNVKITCDEETCDSIMSLEEL